MRLRPLLVAIITCLGLAGCGGSSPSSSTQATATPAASAQTSTGVSTATPTSSTAGATTTTTSASAPPEVPKTKTHKEHHGSGGSGTGGSGSGASPAGASQGAHVEANVTIAANGDIAPPVVSVPSGIGVELHVTNHGSAVATVVLSTPHPLTLHIAPRATGALKSAGLKDGTYRILINGTPRGQLLIGAQGGP